jgi:hypothetical protein
MMFTFTCIRRQKDKQKMVDKTKLEVADPFGLAKKKFGNKKAHPLSRFTVAQWEVQTKHNSSYLKVIGHGGGCCGMKHFRQFPGYDIMWEQLGEKKLQEYIKIYPGQIYEAVLTQQQANEQDGAWVKYLLKLGFRLVNSNTNSNSKNENFVFHLCTAPVISGSTKELILKLQKEILN